MFLRALHDERCPEAPTGVLGGPPTGVLGGAPRETRRPRGYATDINLVREEKSGFIQNFMIHTVV